MFRFTQEPSSGSQSQCLTKITGMVPLCLSIWALSVLWRHIPTCCACVYTRTAGTDFGSLMMVPAWTEICRSSFYIFNVFNNPKIYIIECISWTIKCLILYTIYKSTSLDRFVCQLIPVPQSQALLLRLSSSEVSPTRCNNCVFILRNGFTLHVSGDNLTHHQEYICCIWPQVSRLT